MKISSKLNCTHVIYNSPFNSTHFVAPAHIQCRSVTGRHGREVDKNIVLLIMIDTGMWNMSAFVLFYLIYSMKDRPLPRNPSHHGNGTERTVVLSVSLAFLYSISKDTYRDIAYNLENGDKVNASDKCPSQERDVQGEEAWENNASFMAK